MKLFGTDPTTREGARKAVRTAAIAGFVSAGLTLAVILVVRYSGANDMDGLFSPWSLIDVAIVAALSYGTLRTNRFAAAGLLGFYALNRIVMLVLTGGIAGLGLTFVFVALFAQGAWGAFTLHRLAERDPLADQVDALAAPEVGPTV